MVWLPLVPQPIPTMNHYGCCAQLALPKLAGTPCMSAQQKFYKRTKNLKACIVQEVGTWERSLKSKEEKIITQKGPSLESLYLASIVLRLL